MDPKKKAVALHYQPPKDRAPRVIAKGQGHVADKIIEIARENGIPVDTDPDLVEILSKVDLYAEIPPEMYLAVAEILAFVYRLKSDGPSTSPNPMERAES